MSTVPNPSPPAAAAAAPVSTVATARVAGRYELIEPIGAGGAGTVYRARDHVLGRDVAMKVFKGDEPLAHDVVRQEREIRMLSALEHPGLISIYDAGRQNFDGTIRRFVVMELVADATLESRMSGGTVGPHEAAIIGGQIADALAFVHSRGVVHRDVKPANILLGGGVGGTGGFRLTAKLGDFGIAHFIDGNRLTSDGTILGTAGYLSPEQVSGENVGVSSDVYSLGLVLLEAQTGVFEYPGTPIESAVARVNRDPKIPDTLGEEWRMLLGAMTARKPEDRPTAAEVASILHGRPEAAISGTGRRSVAARAHRRTSFATVRAHRRRMTAMTSVAIAGALIACVVSFLAGYLLRG